MLILGVKKAGFWPAFLFVIASLKFYFRRGNLFTFWQHSGLPRYARNDGGGLNFLINLTTFFHKLNGLFLHALLGAACSEIVKFAAWFIALAWRLNDIKNVAINL